MRRTVRESRPGLRLPPLLLNRAPGIGKSHWARRLGQLLSWPTTTIEATGEKTSFSLVDCQRGWSSASPGHLLERVFPPFSLGSVRRTYAAIFSFWAGVMPSMPHCPATVCLKTMTGMFGRSLVQVHSHCVAWSCASARLSHVLPDFGPISHLHHQPTSLPLGDRLPANGWPPWLCRVQGENFQPVLGHNPSILAVE